MWVRVWDMTVGTQYCCMDQHHNTKSGNSGLPAAVLHI
jgi:hypothetical protein